MEKHFLTDPDKMIVCKNAHEIMIFNRFKPGTNMMIRFVEGNENSFLMPEAAPFEMWHHGRLWAQCWDNNAPFFTTRYGIIGANHGSPYTFVLDSTRHWLFNRDIGTVFTDDAGSRFVLISVESSSRAIFHSDIPAAGEAFADRVCGELHSPCGATVSGKITRGQLPPERGGQLCPHYRYNSVKFYADDQPVPDGEFCRCSKAELFWDIDLILPDIWLEKLKSSPGQYLSPVDPELPGAINCRFTTVFRPGCRRTVDCELTFLQDFPEYIRFGMLQFYTETKFARHERLIPGMKKFHLNGMDIDLANGFRFPENFPISHPLFRTDAADPRRLPDRSIDFFGDREREIAVVLGYSLTRGITARGKEEQRSNLLLQLPSSTKNYPYALEKTEVRKGEKFLISAYQHYFAPDDSGVSCFHLEQADGYFVYLDVVRNCENFTVTLPPETAGKKYAFLEHAPAVSLKTPGDTIPAEPVLEFSASGCGSAVLQIKL